MHPADRAQLARAKERLEKQSLAVKLTDYVGRPIELGIDRLPAKWAGKVQLATHAALQTALDVAVRSLDTGALSPPPANRMHKLMAAASGALGGAFGFATFALELPLSTTIMLRSIADVARSEGEDLAEIQSRLSCIEVFALGAPSKGDDAAETGYFAVRAALAKSVSDAARHLAAKGVSKEGAPAIVNLVSKVATRFGIQVSEKAAAQAIPLIGAAAGAAINTVFIDHFQNVAQGHFVIRRLERKYEKDEVSAEYRLL